MHDVFALWAPFDILKGDPNGGSEEPMVGKIGGIISVETTDQQGETLMQKGVDWHYFLEKGWFNYEHQSGPENVLGHPERVTSVMHKGRPATAVEGVIYLHKAKGKEIFETAKAMRKAGTSRRLGFSVEGRVIERDPSDRTKILKAQVLNVALTAHPVHPDARMEVLMRSMAMVGYQNPATPSAGSISPLVPQHLEATPTLASYGVAAMRQKKMSIEELANHLSTAFPSLSFGQAMTVATEIARSVRHM